MPRPRPPAWLKPLILPAWNGSHRLARRAGEYLGAVRHGRFGRCVICGRWGPWLYRRRVVTPKLEELWGLTPRLAEALARKESSDCAWCGAKLRARRIARVLLDLYPVATPAAPARSVAAWVKTPEARALRVAEVNEIEGLHRPLTRLPRLAYSEYFPGVPSGAVYKRLRVESLTELSYPDGSFELLLTSETLEHVSDLDAALREVFRVLVPGGRHIFTVPVLPGVPATFTRCVYGPGGRVHHAPEIYHPGGDRGYLVFTEFGADLPEILERAGFAVTVAFGPVREDDLAQVWVTQKRG